MHYEIHITVFTTDINKFKKDCKDIGVKPIVIETEHPNGFNEQVMTSSKHYYDEYNIETSWKNKLKLICEQLEEKGYEIIRKKVEKQPERYIDDDNHVYFETHLRLRLDSNDKEGLIKDYENIKEICKDYNFHLSKNLFKKNEKYIYQMITHRDYGKNLNQFELTLANAKDRLHYGKWIYVDKIEVEECIYDSNEKVDDSWFNG